jgi:hypothetical protein
MDNLTSSGHTNIVEVGGDKVAFIPGARQTLGLEYFFDLCHLHLQTDNEVRSSTQVTRASEERGPSLAGFARLAEVSQKQQAWRSLLRKLHVRLLYVGRILFMNPFVTAFDRSCISVYHPYRGDGLYRCRISFRCSTVEFISFGYRMWHSLQSLLLNSVIYRVFLYSRIFGIVIINRL